MKNLENSSLVYCYAKSIQICFDIKHDKFPEPLIGFLPSLRALDQRNLFTLLSDLCGI